MTAAVPKEEPPRARGRLAFVVALALVLGGVTAFLWPREGATPSGGAGDPFAFSPPASRPVGEPIPLRSTLAAGQRFSGRGTLAYRQSGGGRYGGLPVVPDRSVTGRFTFERRVEGGGGEPLRSTIEAKVSYADDAKDGTAPVAKEADVTLTFEHGKPDATSRPTTKLSAPDDLRPALVILAEAFTQRTPLVGLDPRVGEAFVPAAAMDVEPLRRQAFKLFNFNERGLAPVEGVVWLDRVVGAPSDEAIVRAWLRHAQAGPSSAPKQPLVTTDYETVVRASYAVGLSDGLAHRTELSDALRTRYRSDAFDYHADVEREVTIEESRAK